MKYHPEYHGVHITTARKVIRAHYGLPRLPSDSEVRAEIDNCLRHRKAMSADDRIERLTAALGLSLTPTTRDPVI